MYIEWKEKLYYKGRDNYKSCRNIRQREWIQNETPDKRLQILRERIQNETPEVRDKRLQILQVKHKVRIERETPEVRDKRIQILREWIQNETPILHLYFHFLPESEPREMVIYMHHPCDHFDVVMSVWLPLAVLR